MSKTVVWMRPPEAASAALEQALAGRGLVLAELDGPAGLAALADRPDLGALLVDASQLDAAARFRDDLKDLRDRDLPLLVLSRSSDLATRLGALRQGACAFFPPPLDEAAVAAKVAELTGVGAALDPYRVMVVDDDPAQANFAAAILRKAGIEVCTVTETLQILDTLRTCQPDLILMDVYMPDASGVELTSIIRAQKELMHIPIVYLSAEHDPDKQLDALSAGGEDFLTKPIRPRHLLATVRNRVDRARQLRTGGPPPRRGEGDPALVRKAILEQLERIHADPAHGQGQATGLFYLELDNPILLLEQVNLAGIDQLMSGIAAVAQGLAGPRDRVCRFGDFCLVVIAQRPDEAELVGLARRLRAAIADRPFPVDGEPISGTVSVGLRLLHQRDQDANRLINEAIRASHQARVAAGDGVQVQRTGPHPPAEEEALDGRLLERVMDPENLQILYQPIVPLQSGREALYQCLLRLRGPDGGMLSAAEFIPTVEQTGKILKLDRWVIYKALAMLRQVQRGGAGPLRLFVSQSSTALRDLQRLRWLEETLLKTRVHPQGLVLEFRFPEIAREPEAAREYLAALRRLGVGVSLNSLRELDALEAQLDRLPADFVKITEGQIRNYPDTWGNLVRRAHHAGMRAIVSRIEHPELLGQLWSNEVDYIQGNFIQHPGEDLTYDFTGAVLG